LGFVVFVVPLLIVGFSVAVDPYYLFGMPSWRGFNLVRPYYEPYAVAAKPHQVWRMRPKAVVLGASSPEVGIDPHHPGWETANVFNFSIPASTSYATMLAFLHAQRLGARHAVASLDFFSFNINFPLGALFSERRFSPSASADFAKYLEETLPSRPKVLPTSAGSVASHWNEALYVGVNQDVAAAIARKEFKSGREHYELAGRAEHREGAVVPEGWDELGYLQAHQDVALEISRGAFISGYHHYLAAGRAEGRLGGFQPKDWDEAGYLAANPDARNRVALGIYRTGFIHYAAIGRNLGLLGGFPPANALERLRQSFPDFDDAMFNIREVAQMSFTPTAIRAAISTVFRQFEPADFNDAGMRVWNGRDDIMKKSGGIGKIVREKLTMGGWRPWLPLPKMQHCFTSMETGMTSFDRFRFMLRRAYAEGTDLQLFTTPLNAAFYELFRALDLYERYEFWLKELVLINEEEATRAGSRPFPLWHFGDVNTVTSEPIPSATNTEPMKYYWDSAHYRKSAGDLILDRIFNYRDPARVLPDDFGISLTKANIDGHLASTRAKLADWASSNAELAMKIAVGPRNPNAQTRQAEATCW
jgi:hypothetical protein